MLQAEEWQFGQAEISDCQGDVREITFAKPRKLVVGSPIVFLTDGQLVPQFAGSLTSTATQHQPVLVGVHSKEESRAQDYLYSDSEAYMNHEHLFVDMLPKWAESYMGIRFHPRHRILSGFSNGGAFVLTAGLRHSERFDSIVAFSVPKLACFPDLPEPKECGPSVYLAVGNQGAEKLVRKNVIKLARRFHKAKIPVNCVERSTNHNLEFWLAEFPRAVEWWMQSDGAG